MKNDNIRGDFATQPEKQKRPQCKNAQKCKKYQILKKFSWLVSLTRNFIIFIFLEQLTAMPQLNMQNVFVCFLFCFFFNLFFLAVIMIRTLYFICINFVKKKYNNILANINSESPRVIFSFFVFIQWVKHFVPQQIL